MVMKIDGRRREHVILKRADKMEIYIMVDQLKDLVDRPEVCPEPNLERM